MCVFRICSFGALLTPPNKVERVRRNIGENSGASRIPVPSVADRRVLAGNCGAGEIRNVPRKSERQATRQRQVPGVLSSLSLGFPRVFPARSAANEQGKVTPLGCDSVYPLRLLSAGTPPLFDFHRDVLRQYNYTRTPSGEGREPPTPCYNSLLPVRRACVRSTVLHPLRSAARLFISTRFAHIQTHTHTPKHTYTRGTRAPPGRVRAIPARFPPDFRSRKRAHTCNKNETGKA